jgi:CRISPR/Cas system-associated exonuclease Cas4 (RecB family)
MNTSFDPDRPLWLCEVTEEPVSERACLACAQARLQPACPFNAALLKALAAAQRPDATLCGLHQTGYPVLRVSSLTGCARQGWYALRAEPRLETPGAYWARLRGTIFHHALEGMGDGHVERRLVAFVYDAEVAAFVSGRIDGYDPETGVLHDYKTTRCLPTRVSEHHRRQVELYAWLLHRNGFGLPTHIRILYISMANVKSFDVPVPTPDQLDALETDLLDHIHRLLAAEPPEAMPREPWECKYCAFTQCPAHEGKASE